MSIIISVEFFLNVVNLSHGIDWYKMTTVKSQWSKKARIPCCFPPLPLLYTVCLFCPHDSHPNNLSPSLEENI